MTKEEIIEAISEDKMMPFIQPEQLSGIVDFVIKNYKPFLPSNLDDAAEKYEQEFSDDATLGEAFIDGAEWMAGQGETAIVKVDVNGMNTPIVYLWGDKWKKYSGDEVVVQIRKAE